MRGGAFFSFFRDHGKSTLRHCERSAAIQVSLVQGGRTWIASSKTPTLKGTRRKSQPLRDDSSIRHCERSAAIQMPLAQGGRAWIAASKTPRNDGSIPRNDGLLCRHCERSAAIQMPLVQDGKTWIAASKTPTLKGTRRKSQALRDDISIRHCERSAAIQVPFASHGRAWIASSKTHTLKGTRHKSQTPRNDAPHPTGFTLLEVLVVLTILGFLVAMVIPAVGMLDDLERERRTRQRLDEIRAAILGPEGRFDAQGRPIIGGYVGDMRAWPDLWEARAEIKPNVTGLDWSSPSTLTGHNVGQGPGYLMEPNLVFYRPSGTFSGGRWKWHTPYRKLTNDTTYNRDHIGGLETENEGQPRGLWTRYVEDLHTNLAGHAAPGQVLDDRWKGPYLTPPQEGKPADSDHWATDDGMYANLKPRWLGTYETWEDGDYNPTTGELGEHYDDKESFRLLQTADRLADGWDRALRFFITEDTDNPGHTLFWIVSEGADRDGHYPNKGGQAGHGHSSWNTVTNNTMGRAYNPDHPKNKDNIVMKLSSRDWQGIFDAEDARKTSETETLLHRIRQALIGDGPMGFNSGYTGDMADWPRLFQWEGSAWDSLDGSEFYTTGQPRGLWTDRPGLPADNLNATRFGLGWRHSYIGAPHEAEANNVLRDPWDRDILFFKDDANDALLILSKGVDGRFDFGTNNGTHPTNPTEAFDVTAYDPLLGVNADNRHVIITGNQWRRGYFQLQTFTVLNAESTTKGRFFASAAAPVDDVDLFNATTLIDNNWVQGNATEPPVFAYPNLHGSNATTGGRVLVFWNDDDDNGEPDTGEYGLILHFPITTTPGSTHKEALTVDRNDFVELP